MYTILKYIHWNIDTNSLILVHSVSPHFCANFQDKTTHRQVHIQCKVDLKMAHDHESS